MDTRADVVGMVAGLVGDPDRDWITDSYLNPLIQVVWKAQLLYLKGSCSPYIEDVVLIPGVNVGVDPSALTPSAIQGAPDPLQRLVTPRLVDFKPAGAPANQYRPANEFGVLPDTVQQISNQNYDLRIRGDVQPKCPVEDSDTVELHPMMGVALAQGVAAQIGAERPNDGWYQKYGEQATETLDNIAADLIRQQQHLTFRVGGANRGGRANNGFSWNLQGSVGWEWRSNKLYVQLV